MTCICLGNVHTKFSCELIVKRETSLVEKFECDAEKTTHMKYPYHGCTSNTTISVNFMLFLLNVVKKCFVEETLKKSFALEIVTLRL